MANNPLAVHLVNLLSNLLADDPLSRRVRRLLLGLLGIRLGRRSFVCGGGYFAGGNLKAGHDCFINRNCYFDFVGCVTLGDGVSIGNGTTVLTGEHAFGPPARRAGAIRPRDVHIGDGAWIGANVTIQAGVTIGRGAVVGAGAVVTRDIPPDTVAVGVPARVLRHLDPTSCVPLANLSLPKR